MNASIRAGLACAALLACLTGRAAEPSQPLPPIPDRLAEEQLRDTPAPWRNHLRAVRAVQGMEDPLARCLAWPDLPGHTWPEGHADAHCRYHFTPVPSPADVDLHLVEGRVAELEALLAARFEGHGRARHPDESVHWFFHAFTEDGDTPQGHDADRISRRWLELSPGSAYALVARAAVLRKRGWEARGSAWARDTTPEQFAAMEASFAEAAPLYQRALEIAPGLTDAHIGLVDILKSQAGGGEAFFVEQARRVAPGCAEVALDFMRALEPRWGGSFEAMLAYAKVLEPEVAASPLIANQLSAPYVAAIEAEHREDVYTAEAAQAIDPILAMSSNEDMLSVAAAANFHRTDGSAKDEAKAVAYLLQRQRFKALTAWEGRKIGEYLVRQEPEWSLSVLVDAVAQDPGSGWGRYYLAAANYNSGRFEEAERQYLLAVAEPDTAERSLVELVGMWMLDAGLAPEAAARRAGPHLEELLRRYPDNGRAQFFELMRDGQRDGRIERARMEAWIRIADPGDPLQKSMIDHFEGVLAH